MRIQKIKQIAYHLNPLLWIRSLYIHVVVTCCLFVYYFGSALIIVLIGLMAFFALDKYSVAIDAGKGKYISPFSQQAMFIKDTTAKNNILKTNHLTFNEIPQRRYHSIQDEVNNRLKQMK